MIEEVLKAFTWVFSGIGNGWFSKEKSNLIQVNVQVVAPENVSKPKIQEIEEKSYSVELGTRLKQLREKTLHLEKEKRKMADFYGYTKVYELEKYESGEDEFPQESIDKLQEFFFINRQFIEQGSGPIFRTFNIDLEVIKKFLQDGFKVKILGSPNEDNTIETSSPIKYTRPIFYKEEGCFTRLAVAELGYLNSSGGGDRNIGKFISIMLELQDPRYIPYVLKTDQKTWDKLRQGAFYSNITHIGIRDEQYTNIFEDWYRETEDRLYPERNESLYKLCETLYGNKS